MTAYRTCHNCALAKLPCARRDSLQTEIKGLGITSLKFACSERKPLFVHGQRVATTWPVSGDYDGEGTPEVTDETWPATIIRESGSRFLAVVDDVRSDYDTPADSYFKNAGRFVRASASRLAPLDEPVREICPACDSSRGEDGRFTGCYAYETVPGQYGGYRPDRCAQDPKK